MTCLLVILDADEDARHQAAELERRFQRSRGEYDADTDPVFAYWRQRIEDESLDRAVRERLRQMCPCENHRRSAA